MAYGLLLLRVVIGGTMFGHGAQKLFGWFGGYGPKGTGGFFEQLGFRAPVLKAVAAGLSEASGVLLAAGFLTPLASLAIVVVMLNAIWTVHWTKGFWNANGALDAMTGALHASAEALTRRGTAGRDRVRQMHDADRNAAALAAMFANKPS